VIDRPEADTIAAALASREGRVLALSILGTANAVRIVGDLDSFCTVRLGSAVREVFFCELSVGAAFGLRLHDDRRVLLKVHPPDRTSRFLEAVYRVQRHLYARGFPCPEPSCGPLPFGSSLATVEAFIDDGKYVDAHDPEIRREMARALARMIELSAEVSDVGGLSRGWRWPHDALWPEPHNALFDFAATTAGADWIDEVAAEGKRIVDNSPGRIVVGHSDWSVKHFRFEGGKIRVTYDWDSLRLDRETVIVGTAAATFPATWYLEVASRAPTPQEMRSFVQEYEAERGKPLARREREAIAATATYVIAYSARCEHALDSAGEDLGGGFREALARYGEEYLRL
jgi:Phosphotransferase enzyme family